MTPAKIRWVITASDLLLGDVIYLDAEGHWQRQLNAAHAYASAKAADSTLARLAQRWIVGAYVMRAALAPDGTLIPMDLRERFRSRGPTNRALGKQVLGSV